MCSNNIEKILTLKNEFFEIESSHSKLEFIKNKIIKKFSKKPWIYKKLFLEIKNNFLNLIVDFNERLNNPINNKINSHYLYQFLLDLFSPLTSIKCFNLFVEEKNFIEKLIVITSKDYYLIEDIIMNFLNKENFKKFYNIFEICNVLKIDDEKLYELYNNSYFLKGEGTDCKYDLYFEKLKYLILNQDNFNLGLKQDTNDKKFIRFVKYDKSLHICEIQDLLEIDSNKKTLFICSILKTKYIYKFFNLNNIISNNDKKLIPRCPPRDRIFGGLRFGEMETTRPARSVYSFLKSDYIIIE
jgi:hypothetical protein